MDEHIIPFDGHGESDFLSLINAEADKVEPAITVPPSLPDGQQPSPELPLSPPTPSEGSKSVRHLNAETFSEPTLPKVRRKMMEVRRKTV